MAITRLPDYPITRWFWLSIEIAATTLWVTAAVRVLSFRALVRIVSARPRIVRRPSVSVEARTALVEGVGRRIAGSTCLVKALVLFTVLQRRGIEPEVIVAVARSAGRLDAHAWVRLQDAVICGGPERAGYVPVFVLRSHSASSAAAA